MGELSSKKATLEWDSCPECMNVDKTNFTFPLNYKREWLFYEDFYMA